MSHADPVKHARVEALINEFPEWWNICVWETSLDLLAKLGRDPREPDMAAMFVASFIKSTEVLPDKDADYNPICTVLGAKLHPTIDFKKHGFVDELVKEGQAMYYLHMEELMHPHNCDCQMCDPVYPDDDYF